MHTFSFSAPASAGIPSRIWRTRKADSGLRDAPRRLHRPPQPSGPRVRLIFLGREGGARGRRGAVPGLGGAAAARAAEAGGRAAPRGLRALSAGAGPLRARGARGCARVRSWALAAAAAVPLSQQTPPPASPPAWPCPEEPSVSDRSPAGEACPRAARVGAAAEGRPFLSRGPAAPRCRCLRAGKSLGLPGLEPGSCHFPSRDVQGRKKWSARLPGEGMGSITSRSRGSWLKRHPGERVGRRWNPGAPYTRPALGGYIYIFKPLKGVALSLETGKGRQGFSWDCGIEGRGPRENPR